MVRISHIAAAVFSVAIATTAYAHAAASAQVITAAPGAELTLGSAKQAVSQQLAGSGQRNLRPGHAQYDSQGNVDVELLTTEGLRIGHMLVRPDAGGSANASAAPKAGQKG
jgi:hypothetical protein